MAKHILTLEVENELQARELNHAWKEILRGKIVHAAALDHAQETIMERARLALKRIETAVDRNAGTGQARILVRFLAGVYCGSDYPFDLTDLRALDTELANACLDYLSYDRLAKQEVHHHLAGGDRALQGWLADYKIERELKLSAGEADSLDEIAEKTGRTRLELLDEAVADFIAKHQRQKFVSKASTTVTTERNNTMVTQPARALSADEIEGMAWWNALSEAERTTALKAAGWTSEGASAPSVADAWVHHKRTSVRRRH